MPNSKYPMFCKWRNKVNNYFDNVCPAEEPVGLVENTGDVSNMVGEALVKHGLRSTPSVIVVDTSEMEDVYVPERNETHLRIMTVYPLSQTDVYWYARI